MLRAYVGNRTNRRHRPGRAFERTAYRFDVLTDYGAFRDLQRHRLLTLEWQPSEPAPRLHRAGRDPRSGRRRRLGARDGRDRPSSTRRSLQRRPEGRRALRCRDGLPGPVLHGDERARSDARHRAAHRAAGTPRLSPRLPADAPPDRRRAGHRAVADAMRFADHSEVELERLGSERALEKKRATQL